MAWESRCRWPCEYPSCVRVRVCVCMCCIPPLASASLRRVTVPHPTFSDCSPSNAAATVSSTVWYAALPVFVTVATVRYGCRWRRSSRGCSSRRGSNGSAPHQRWHSAPAAATAAGDSRRIQECADRFPTKWTTPIGVGRARWRGCERRRRRSQRQQQRWCAAVAERQQQ